MCFILETADLIFGTCVVIGVALQFKLKRFYRCVFKLPDKKRLKNKYILVRHGESVANAQQIVVRWTFIKFFVFLFQESSVDVFQIFFPVSEFLLSGTFISHSSLQLNI